MTFANLDVYFHMVNHYKKIRKAKAVVDCSSPKGYNKKQCNCKPVNLPRCTVQPPSCTARNRVRSCSPEYPQYRPICTARIPDYNRCYSAPACKRPDIPKDWYTCQNKARQLREFKLETLASRMQPQKRPVKPVKNKSPKSPQNGKNNEPGDDKEGQGEKETGKSGDVVTKETDEEPKISEVQEHEYVHFLLKITEDILRNNIFKDAEMEKLFESHIKANLGRLNEDRMRAQIDHLKKELNLPLPQRELHCRCDNEVVSSDCKCCSAEPTSGTCSCNNAKCPKRDSLEKMTSEDVTAVPVEDDIQDLMADSGKLENLASSQCRCDDENLAKSCPAHQVPPETCQCSNPTCPGIAPQEEDNPAEKIEAKLHPQSTDTFHCNCDDESPQIVDCKCCPGYESGPGTCSCSNPKCPGRDSSKEIDADQRIDEETKESEAPESKDSPPYEDGDVVPTQSEIEQSEADKTKAETVTPKKAETEMSTTTFEEPTKHEMSSKSESTKELTCEELKCCPEIPPVMLEKEKYDEFKEESPRVSIASTEKLIIPDKNTSKVNTDCLDPLNCHSPDNNKLSPEAIDANTTKSKSHSAHSFKIVNKHDPDTESQVVFYNPPDDADEHCFCAITFQRTALKIQADDENKDVDYILVDGPVCMPRTMLENKTIQILIQNVSSMVLDPEKPSEESGPIPSQVNLFQFSAKNEFSDNLDSVSGQIKRMRREEAADYDMTPERDMVTEVIATPNKNLEPILKKKENSDHTAGKDVVKNASVAITLTSVGEVDDGSPMEGSTGDTKDMLGEDMDEPAQTETDTLANKEKKQEFPDEEVSTSRAVAEESKDDFAKARIPTPAKKEEVIRPEERSPFLHSAGSICSVGSCTRDICPKKLKKEKAATDTEKRPPVGGSKVALGEIVSISTQSSVLSEGESKQETYKVGDEYLSPDHPSDSTNMYHFLLVDAATSISFSDLPHHKGRSRESFQQKEYTLLMNTEYQAEKLADTDMPPRKLTITSEKSSTSDEGPTVKPMPIASHIITELDDASRISKESSYEALKEDKVESDLKLHKYSTPGQMIAQEDEDKGLAYTQRKLSDSLTERLSPAIKQNDNSQMAVKPHEGLKVRYSVNRDIFDQEHHELIAKLDQQPELASLQSEREAENILTIADRMKDFRKLDDEENANRRFQISNPDSFEIRRMSPPDNEDTDEETQKKAKRCCGLPPPKSKKRVAAPASITEPRASRSPNF